LPLRFPSRKGAENLTADYASALTAVNNPESRVAHVEARSHNRHARTRQRSSITADRKTSLSWAFAA